MKAEDTEGLTHLSGKRTAAFALTSKISRIDWFIKFWETVAWGLSFYFHIEKTIFNTGSVELCWMAGLWRWRLPCHLSCCLCKQVAEWTPRTGVCWRRMSNSLHQSHGDVKIEPISVPHGYNGFVCSKCQGLQIKRITQTSGVWWHNDFKGIRLYIIIWGSQNMLNSSLYCALYCNKIMYIERLITGIPYI